MSATVSFSGVAREARDKFETFQRPGSGRTLYRLRDETDREGWAYEAVRVAHGDMLPDDWRYQWTFQAFDYLTADGDPDPIVDDGREAPELDDDAVVELAHDFAEITTSEDVSELMDWYGSLVSRSGYVTEAVRELHGDCIPPEFGVPDQLRMGQFAECEEVFWSVYESVRNEYEARRTLPPGCTGYRDDAGRLQHDGDTCPVHETGPTSAYVVREPRGAFSAIVVRPAGEMSLIPFARGVGQDPVQLQPLDALVAVNHGDGEAVSVMVAANDREDAYRRLERVFGIGHVVDDLCEAADVPAVLEWFGIVPEPDDEATPYGALHFDFRSDAFARRVEAAWYDETKGELSLIPADDPDGYDREARELVVAMARAIVESCSTAAEQFDGSGATIENVTAGEFARRIAVALRGLYWGGAA